MRDTKAQDYLMKTKNDATRMYNDACEDVACWEQVINDCDQELGEIAKERPMYGKARIAIMVVIVLILATVALSGCQTLQGGLNDLSWGAKTLADNINVSEGERK